MDASEFEKCLGQPELSPDVQALLANLGVKGKLKPGPEGYVRIELLERGLLLSFTPAEPKSSQLRFSGVQFYSNLEQDFSTYSGTLPGGLTFDDTAKEAREKLGKPTKIMKDFNIDQWIADGRQIQARYSKSRGTIAYILLGFPRAAKN